MFEILKLEKFQSEFKTFIVENRLVGTAAGVTIGISTKDVIQSAVGDIIIPFIYLIIGFLGIKKVDLLAGKTEFDIISFIRQFITWILSIIAVFFFVYYFFMTVVGIDKPITETKPKTPPLPPPTQQTTQKRKIQTTKKGPNDYDAATTTIDSDNTESFYQRYSATV
jgi:large conductance mechanosensitive channel